MHRQLPLPLLFSLLLTLPAHGSAGIQKALGAYVNTFYLAEARLQDFDEELAAATQPGLLATSAAYRDLLALRNLLEERQHEIKDQFGKLREHDGFSAHLRTLDPADRIALNDLVKELGNQAPGLPVFYATLEEEQAARQAAASFILVRTELARQDRSLAREVRGIAKSIHFPRPAPHAMKIEPSAGPAGTIDGSQFPASTWALTFDDGPHPTYTPQILANLEAMKKKASFLWLWECLEPNKTIPAKAQALGMSVNNHSWTHPNLAKANSATLAKEITQSTFKEENLYGESPRFFRLPYGAGVSSFAPRKVIADNALIHVFWNVDSLDWKDKVPKSVLERVKKEMLVEKRGIILFHDIHPQSVAASDLVLKYSATLDGTPEAHRWVILDEIVDELNAGK